MTKPADNTPGHVLMVIGAVVGLVFLVVALDEHVGPPTPDISPYVGQCLEPSTRGGC